MPLLLDPETPSFRHSHLEPHDLDGARWMFEVVFDYGEGHYDEEAPDEEGRVWVDASPFAAAPWPARPDPFSSYRSGFEIRTCRLRRRVLLFHHFPEELGAEPGLVRSTAFESREKPIGSFLARVVQSGHRRCQDRPYLTRSLPPLDLHYTASPLEDADFAGYRLEGVDPADLANLPAGIDNQAYRLLDLDGKGIAGVLSEQAAAWLYKPNLGGGRFGATRTVAERPSLAAVGEGRQQFMDLTGDGVADILVTEDDAFTWHPSLLSEGFGRGRCIPVPLDEERGPRVVFADSAQSLYLADKAAGTPWVTRLPFPVHVVERVETCDDVSRNRFITRYSYHHGFYDGVEREFRGFGRVDQLDTEAFAAFSATGAFPQGDNIDAASSVPPVLTRTWYHTGVFLEGGRISRHLAHEYYQEGAAHCGETELSHEQMRAMLLDDTILPEQLTPEEAREACRSLKGSMLQQEVYDINETEAASRPYGVAENNFTIRTVQRRGPNRHAVFFTHAREQVNFHYERKLYDVDGRRRADPRVAHTVTLAVDDYGNVLKAVAIGYGRRFPDPSPLLSEKDREQQARLLLTLTENDYTNAVQEADAWRTPLPAEQRLYESLKMKPEAELPGITNLFRFRELMKQVAAAVDGAHDLPFQDWEGLGAVADAPYRRLLKKAGRSIAAMTCAGCCRPVCWKRSRSGDRITHSPSPAISSPRSIGDATPRKTCCTTALAYCAKPAMSSSMATGAGGRRPAASSMRPTRMAAPRTNSTRRCGISSSCGAIGMRLAMSRASTTTGTI